MTQLQALQPASNFGAFENTTWRFGKTDGPVYCIFLKLFSDNRIGGYIHPNEKYWRLTDEGLTFHDQTGQVTTLFNKCETDPAGQRRLTGVIITETMQRVEHYLEETSEPLSICTDPNKFKLDKNTTGKKRRNLVILGANENSLHHSWPNNLRDADRTWDLCVSFYGAAANYSRVRSAEYSSLQTGVRKWQAIHSALHETSPFWDYERIFILDDDIRTSWRDINLFLEICRDFDLQLAQPSLTPHCYVNIPITRQVPGNYVRFTTYVEAMAPCFTRDALRKCIATTAEGYYGFGFDHIWPRILNLPKNKIGIVDAVAINHTRPLATNYSLDLAHAEEIELFKRYGLPVQKLWFETGRILRAF
ncbi:MAG: hypothetical protein B7Z75_05155 [Acidocella sp. 20-57-95]|nr:MAG: hypothetical protein B7Z75_05155 [Acidocella sp. 20-57-95]HQT64667.1 hypothetical protein [Acidocella sp.]